MLMFEQKRAWIDHEMEKHFRSWLCYLCKFSSDKQSEVTLHLERHHPETLSGELQHIMTYMTSRPLDYLDASRCKLCDWDKSLSSKDSNTTVSRASFMGHSSHHLEQLALFAIPRIDPGEISGSLGTKRAAVDDSQVSSDTNATSDQVLEKLLDLRDQLRYPEMFVPQQIVKPPMVRTFEWIWEEYHEGKEGELRWSQGQFSLWLRSTGSLFWISGMPDSGKSTLVSTIQDDQRTCDALST